MHVCHADTWFGKFTADAYSAVRVGGGGSGAFHACTFADNTATAEPSATNSRRNSGDASTEVGGPAVGLVATPQPSGAWLQGCMFTGGVTPVVGDVAIESDACPVYSNSKETPQVYSIEQGVTMTPQYVYRPTMGRDDLADQNWGPPSGGVFLNEDAANLVFLRQVC